MNEVKIKVEWIDVMLLIMNLGYTAINMEKREDSLQKQKHGNHGKRRLSFKVTLFYPFDTKINMFVKRFASFAWRQKLRRRSELLSDASSFVGCPSSPSMSSGA